MPSVHWMCLQCVSSLNQQWHTHFLSNQYICVHRLELCSIPSPDIPSPRLLILLNGGTQRSNQTQGQQGWDRRLGATENGADRRYQCIFRVTVVYNPQLTLGAKICINILVEIYWTVEHLHLIISGLSVTLWHKHSPLVYRIWGKQTWNLKAKESC